MRDTPEYLVIEYASALATQDWSVVSALIDKDAVFIFSDGTYRGIGEIEKAFLRTFELIKEEVYSVENLNWVLKTNAVAVCDYEFRWSGVIDGRSCSGGGRGSSVLEKKEAGWLIVFEHLSSWAT